MKKKLIIAASALLIGASTIFAAHEALHANLVCPICHGHNINYTYIKSEHITYLHCRDCGYGWIFHGELANAPIE